MLPSKRKKYTSDAESLRIPTGRPGREREGNSIFRQEVSNFSIRGRGDLFSKDIRPRGREKRKETR